MMRDKVVDGTAQGPYLAFLLLHLTSKTLLVVHNTEIRIFFAGALLIITLQQLIVFVNHSVIHSRWSAPFQVFPFEVGFNAACSSAPGAVSNRIGLRGSKPASRCHCAISCMDQVPASLVAAK